MGIQLYDKCRLKDGRSGWIVEILGQDEAYLVEVDQKGLDDRIVTVTRQEIVTD